MFKMSFTNKLVPHTQRNHSPKRHEVIHCQKPSSGIQNPDMMQLYSLSYFCPDQIQLRTINSVLANTHIYGMC